MKRKESSSAAHGSPKKLTGRLGHKHHVNGLRWKTRRIGHVLERIWRLTGPSVKDLRVDGEQPVKAETTSFVALKDQDKYIELPRSEVRQRIVKGAFRMSQPVWHPTEQAWKPARTFPSLVPEIQPLPPSGPVSTKEPVPIVVLDKSPPAMPRTKKESSLKPVAKPEKGSTKEVLSPGKMDRPGLDEVDRFLKKSQKSEKIYGILTIVGIILIPILNWLLIDLPLNRAIARSEFKGQVKVRAHFNYLVQFRGLVIHFTAIPENMSGAKLVEMLTVLANSSRGIPGSDTSYHSVSLAKGWETKYIFRGDAWKELSNERRLPAMNRAFLIVNNLCLPNGKQALGDQSDNLFKLQGQKQKCFNDFYLTMVKNKNPGSPSDSSGNKKEKKEPSEIPRTEDQDSETQ